VFEPQQQRGVTGVVSLSNGGDHACALTSEGDVICWGLGSSGQLGFPPRRCRDTRSECAEEPATVEFGPDPK
jgi:alpha-tubulin suppressor-like RCC1 family protein